ncbi:hypothetical protein [Pseudomonas sp. LRF_L74]|uniref:hypothetical protein n=1 Tax=Pseudomonas sp. LRF_L74 TaxID=3369422 RepID=UPI003F63022D
MINRFFKVGVNWFKLAGREIVLSICLGSIPLFLNSGSPKQLKEVMTILLANSFFLWHFAVLLLLWMVVSAAKRGALLQNGSTPKWLDFAHSLSCDLGMV